MIYFVSQDLSPGTPSTVFGVIFSPSAGIVLLFDLRNTEALESERMKKTEDRLSNQAD